MNRFIATAILFLTTIPAGCTVAPEARDDLIPIYRQRVLASTTLDPGDPVPMEFDSYTFFLFPDWNWYRRGTRQTLKHLFYDFQKFGDAIGENNLAVWFFNAKSEPDAERSRYFAQLFSLDPEGGPYIVYAQPETVVPVKMLVREENAIIEKLLSPFELIQVGNAKLFDVFAIDLSQIRPADAPILLRVLTGMLRGGEGADFERLRAAKADLEVSVLVARLEQTSENLLRIAERIQSECRRRGIPFEFRQASFPSRES